MGQGRLIFKDFVLRAIKGVPTVKHEFAESFAVSGALARAGVSHDARSLGAPSLLYFVSKRAFDIIGSVLLLPVLLVVTIVLLIANPFYNRGTVFFAQQRMGRKTEAFVAYKFRSMRAVGDAARGAHDPLEFDRITPLGNFLRKSRLDEIPQIINVLKGDMSLVGPRPDYYPHAKEYIKIIPGYRARHAVRPGISGFAQTEVGYADTIDAVKAKVAADLFYIRNRRIMFEIWIIGRTLSTVFGHKGA